MSRGWLAVLVGVIALLAHLPAREGEFLFYDDGRFIVRNPGIDEIGNPLRFFTDLDTATAPDSRTKDIYRPLRTLTYAAIVQTAGKRASAFHSVSIVLHAVCAGLLMLLLARTRVGHWAAAAGALCFALHPVTVEATAWACSLGDLLCGVFVVLSMLAYATDRRLLAYAALVVALFGKEHAVVVPGLWLAWDYFTRRERLNVSGFARGAGVGLALVVAFLVFRGAVAGANLAQLPEPLGGSHGTAVLTMLAGMGWYAATILFPYGPTFNARVPVQDSLFAAPVWIGLAVVAALAWGVLRGPRRSRLGVAWFLLALVPVSNVIVPLKIPTADRFLYIPLMGLGLVAAEAVARAPRVAVRVAPAVLAVLALLTVARIGDWRDDRALVAAGNRVDRKSKTLLWAEAALSAKRAVEEFRSGNPTLATALAENAGELYRKYLQNAQPWERIQVHMELGDLWWEMAQWSARVDHPNLNLAYSRALESYLQAQKLQIQGVGRVVDEEVRHAGQQIVRLCVLLAQPTNPGADHAIKQGFETLKFLEARYGRWPGNEAVQLALVATIRHRTKDPAKARRDFAQVERMLDAVEERGYWTTFMRAQVLYYRSVLKDRPFNLAELERAVALYERAAKEQPGFVLQARMFAGRALCLLGRLSKSKARIDQGKRLLESLAERVNEGKMRSTEQQRLMLATILTGCGR